eukprot:4779444-Pyramimonas_sp.AAC.1
MQQAATAARVRLIPGRAEPRAELQGDPGKPREHQISQTRHALPKWREIRRGASRSVAHRQIK